MKRPFVNLLYAFIYLVRDLKKWGLDHGPILFSSCDQPATAVVATLAAISPVFLMRRGM